MFLLATGLSLTLGTMGILNLSHGALYMIGAYVGWTIAVQYGLSFGLAILAGTVAAGGVGVFMDRLFFSKLHGQTKEQVLLSLGFVYVITNLTLWVYGPMQRGLFAPPFLSGSFSIGDWLYPIDRATLIPIGLALAGGLWWLQNKTRLGAIVRAGMDDKEMTTGLGINYERACLAVFLLGTALAGFAGVVGGQLFGANIELGMRILILALIVVVVGGTGSVEGALVGAIVIGLTDSIGRWLFPELAMFLLYILMIIVLLARPAGLLGRKV